MNDQVNENQNDSGVADESERQSVDRTERLLQEIRWYGKTIAGGGPVGGFGRAGRIANDRWYYITLPLLMELNAVYGDPHAVGCIGCHGNGFVGDKVCSVCKGVGMNPINP